MRGTPSAPASGAPFIAAQAVGAVLGLGLVTVILRRSAPARTDVPILQASRNSRPRRFHDPPAQEDTGHEHSLHGRGPAPLAGEPVEVRSAGSAPADTVSPAVAEAMREAGIGISAETAKVLTTEAIQAPDVVITTGRGGTCPVAGCP